MSKDLSQIIANLLAKPAAGEDLSSKSRRFRDELRKAVQGEDTAFGKLRGLLDSFREIIPDEKQRYHAALQALSTTSKLSHQEIVKAFIGQLEELKVLEKSLLATLPGWRDELKAMEARSQELKGEMAKLRERVAQLENEEKSVLTGMTARHQEMELAEKTMKELFAEIGGEITSVRKKVEEFTSETPAPPTEPPKSAAPVEKKGGGEPQIEIKGALPALDSKWQKKCPMCGGQMNLLELENMWQCYTCAYEEPTTDAVPGTGEEKSELKNTRASGPVFDPSLFMGKRPASVSPEVEGSKKGASSFGSQPLTKKKDCPVCRKKMFWHPDENAWRCPSCNYERRI